jgi:glycosyltransferase involved in cell wall biosynthesis
MNLHKKPMISVVMAVHNGGGFVRSSINSIVKQTYKNWELLIANDASTDSTNSILKTIKNKKIKIISFKKNIGQYKALDYLFSISKGKYIAVLDSDDLAHPKRLQIQIDAINKDRELALVSSNFKIINDKNKIIRKVNNNCSENIFRQIFPTRNIICFSTIMFKKKILKVIKFFNKYYNYSNDYYFILNVFLKYKIKIINKYLIFYRVHPNQRSKLSTLRVPIIDENIKHLNWAKKNFLINRSNILLFYKELFKNYLKFFYIRLQKKLINFLY